MTGRHHGLWATALFVAGLMLAGNVAAHNRSESYSRWEISDGKVRATITIPNRELLRITGTWHAGEINQQLEDYLMRQFTLQSGSEACRPVGRPQLLKPEEIYQRAELTYECPAAGPLVLQSQLFIEVISGHTHFARIFENGQPTAEYFFTVDSPRQRISGGEMSAGAAAASPAEAPAVASTAHVFRQYFSLGVQHLGGGLDHLAFLLALLILVRKVRNVLIAITGFTAGHSVTLALTVLDVVRPTAAAVEALIGFTIAVVAFESVGQRTATTRQVAVIAAIALLVAAFFARDGSIGVLSALSLAGLALFCISYLYLSELWRGNPLVLLLPLTMAFGLLHGFGFAGNLLAIGIPAEQLTPVLLGFNLGVEVGQILLVSVMGLAFYSLHHYVSAQRTAWVMDTTVAALFSVGLYWFIARNYAVAA